jgi:hypothetical protein
MPCSKVVLHIRKQYFAASTALECRRIKCDLRINHLEPNAKYIRATNFNTQKNLHFADIVYVFCAIYITAITGISRKHIDMLIFVMETQYVIYGTN